MKATELRQLTLADLKAKEVELAEKVFQNRVKQSLGQLDKSHVMQELRRDIARVKTVIQQKETAPNA